MLWWYGPQIPSAASTEAATEGWGHPAEWLFLIDEEG